MRAPTHVVLNTCHILGSAVEEKRNVLESSTGERNPYRKCNKQLFQ